MAGAKTAGVTGKSDSLSIQVRLKNLLESESVQKIYVVDEQIFNDYNFEYFSALVSAAVSANKLTELQKIEIEGHSFLDDIEIALSGIRQNWENWNAEQHREAITAIALITNPFLAADAKQAGKLNKLFDQNLVEYIHPKNWDAKKKDIIGSLKASQKVIVLFDEELNQEDDRKGHDLIRDVKEQKLQSKIVPVLFTNSIQTYQDELIERANIIAELANALSEQDFFALSKLRSENEEDFADGIKKSLLNGYCEQIKAASVSVLENAFKKALENVKKLDTYDFDNIVLRSSYSEGVWEALTFQRIAQIFFEDEVHQEMQGQNYVKRVNKDVRASKKIRNAAEFNVSDTAPYTTKFVLRHRELYLDGGTINKLNFPVDNGDIFEIDFKNIKHQFMLVGQECDLAIRTDANKPEDSGTRKLKIGILLKINLNSSLDKHGMNFQLDYYQPSNKHAYVEFKDAVFVNMDFLDLTVFDPKGQAQIKFAGKKLNGELFSFAWESRYSKIAETLSLKLAETNKLVNELSPRRQKTLKQKIFSQFSFPDNLITPKFEAQRIFLPIRRIKRLRTPYSKSLLERYTRYQSRTADLHDYTTSK